MKVLTTLPDRKHYRSLPSPRGDRFLWEDKASSKVTIVSDLADPFGKEVLIMVGFRKTKGKLARTITGLDLRIFPAQKEAFPATLERDYYPSRLGYTLGLTLFAATFKAADPDPDRNIAELWLGYSIYPRTPQQWANWQTDPDQAKAYLAALLAMAAD